MTRNSQGIVDQLDFTKILEQQAADGAKLTFIVPTDVTGSAETQSMLALKNQLRDAKQQLVARGASESAAASLLEPVAELLEDSTYWRLQSRSLAVFRSNDFFLPVRLPIELAASLTVGDEFNALPLAPVLASDRKLYVLALARNSVRLFDSTRNVIEELPLESIPASFDEVVEEQPERHVDVRSGAAGAAGTPSFQGPDGDIDRMLLEKFIHAVGQAVGARLGTARSQLLVLAAVAEYLPVFTSACPYPAIFDGVIAGNPEHALPNNLRSAAWQLVNAHETGHEAEEQEHARSSVHAGKGSFDPVEISRAAADGRIDTLFVPRDDARIADPETRGFVNRALFGALRNGGTLRTLGQMEGEALATFRY